MLVHPDNLVYTPHHVWVKSLDHHAIIGLTEDLQHEIDAVESVDLPMTGDELEMDIECMGVHLPDGELLHIPCPLTGRVIAVNDDVLDRPETIFLSPYERGWLFKMEFDEPDELEMLMNSREYGAFLEDSV